MNLHKKLKRGQFPIHSTRPALSWYQNQTKTLPEKRSIDQHEHRQKNSKGNFSKSNLMIYWKIMNHNQIGFILEKQGWFNIWKISVIHHISGLKKGKLYDHLSRCRKRIGQNPASISDFKKYSRNGHGESGREENWEVGRPGRKLETQLKYEVLKVWVRTVVVRTEEERNLGGISRGGFDRTRWLISRQRSN